MALSKDRTIITSDVNLRDGIGIEVYRNDNLVVEIFRDDTALTRTVTIFKKDIDLNLLQECIEIFRKEIPWNFIGYDQLKEE